MNREELKDLLGRYRKHVGLALDTDGITEFLEQEFPPVAIVHEYVDLGELDDEEMEELLKDPNEWFQEVTLPSFSFSKGDSPQAEEGEEFYAKINGKFYSFILLEGECVEASWSGSIYRTDIDEFEEIPEDEYGDYNFVEYNMFSRF